MTLKTLEASPATFSAQDLERLLEVSRRQATPLWKLLDERKVDENLVADLFAELLKIPRVPLANVISDPEALKTVPEELARKRCCIPLRVEGKFLQLAMANPADYSTIQDVQFTSGLNVKPQVASRSEINDGIEERYATGARLQDFLANVPDPAGLQIVAEEAESVEVAAMTDAGAAELPPVVKMCNLIIAESVKAKASDIHMEPEPNSVLVRFRVDGVLRDFMHMPKWVQNPAISRVKILSKLDIAERRVPQDGRIRVKSTDRAIDLRVSTLPTQFGEKVVMRLLGSGSVPSLEQLGFSEKQQSMIEHTLYQPQGMLLVTGPTGSGKSTTLYSMLKARQSREVNMVTVEDPIEYQLPGINQAQVNTKAGLTFAKVLRSILRQDPDVILVGEIRDLETAVVAFQAAMTGHMVLSTLHTNSAAASIARLVDLGLDPFQLTSSLSLVLAQRLGRRFCTACQESYTPPSELLERVRLLPDDTKYYRGRGYPDCNQTGYVGRIGFYELLRITPKLRELVIAKASEAELVKAARQEGTQFLLDDARAKILGGITTVEEVLRVVQIEDTSTLRCPRCKAFLDHSFSTCPHCALVLRLHCSSCKEELQPEWVVCPFCSTPTGVSSPESRGQVAGDAGLAPPIVAHKDVPRATHAGSEAKLLHALIVDDDRSMKLLIRRSLEKLPLKCEIAMAGDGEEALARVQKQVPDLVITDVMMPGMDGFTLCQRLREDIRTAFVPIIILTSSVDEDSRTKGFLIGTDDFITKPFAMSDLNARVMRLLRRTYGI